MKNRTVLGLALLLLVQSLSAAIYVLPEKYDNNLEMESLFESWSTLQQFQQWMRLQRLDVLHLRMVFTHARLRR